MSVVRQASACAVLLTVFLSFLQSASGADTALSWPCWRGAGGSGSGTDAGHPLVEDLSEAKLVWASETKELWSGYAYLGGGGCAGPVIIDGRVYVNHSVPAGEILAEAYFARLWPMKKNKLGLKEEQVRDRARIHADDHLLCLDAKTGETLWHHVGELRGINRGMCSRGAPASKTGPHSMPVAAYGKVLAVGNMGWVYCCDAVTGELLWELDWVPEQLKTTKAEALAAKAIPRGGHKGADRMDFCTSPTFAGGVFIVPRGKTGGTLVGLDPATGAERWRVRAGGAENAPLRWVVDDKDFIVCGGVAIDPRSGKELWRQEICHSAGSVAIGEGFLVATGKRGDKGKPETDKGLTCYGITLQGIEQVWQAESVYRSQGHCTPVIYRGHVYTKYADPEQRGRSRFVCIELASGKVVARSASRRTDACGSLIAADGMLYYEKHWLRADPKAFGFSGASQGPTGDQDRHLAASSTPAIVGGLLFTRGQNQVFCFDLRR